MSDPNELCGFIHTFSIDSGDTRIYLLDRYNRKTSWIPKELRPLVPLSKMFNPDICMEKHQQQFNHSPVNVGIIIGLTSDEFTCSALSKTVCTMIEQHAILNNAKVARIIICKELPKHNGNSDFIEHSTPRLDYQLANDDDRPYTVDIMLY